MQQLRKYQDAYCQTKNILQRKGKTMKKFWAIIKLHEDETAQNLLTAMFSKEEFNSQNAIIIREKMAIVEAFFEENPPQKIAETIGGYRDVQCGFGEVSEECLNKAGMSKGQVYSEKKDGGLPPVAPAHQSFEESPSGENVDADDSAEDVPPPTDPKGKEEVPHNEGAEAVEPTNPTEEAERNNQKPQAKTGKVKGPKRKAPGMIPQIQEILVTCTSYQQFTAKVIQWLGIQKRASYLKDVFEVAATVEKVKWPLIEAELSKKGYNNPFAVRNPTSVEVTKKLTELQIDCSFIALVDYVVKYKDFDFRSNIEQKVREILREMGIQKELLGLRQEITDIAIAAVMAESENVDMIQICTAARCGKNEDDILDAKMNFSSFINEFLEKKGMEMMTAEEFIIKLREAIFAGSTIW